MEMLALHQLRGWCLFWLLLCNIIPVSSSDPQWIREPTFDNKSAVSGFNVISRSRIHCSQTCFNDDTCISFFFRQGQHLNCQLLDIILSSSDGLQTVQNTAYYVSGASQTTTTTTEPTVSTAVQSTTTPPPPFSCPPDDTIFRTVLLDDGDHFTYKVVKTQTSQSNAIAGCVAQGSFLARVKTVAKMNMLLNLTRTCKGYTNENDYYVDGSNADASEFNAPGVWKMENGDLVPMSNEFWDNNCPNNPHTEHCLRMRTDSNYLWDDCNCYNKYYYICEI